MKLFLSVIFALLLTATVDAEQSGVTLNEAVNEVKSQGRVLSAKTIGGQHEIKILTPSGTVKTIKRHAGNQANAAPKERSSYQRRRDWSTDFQQQNNLDDLKRQRGYPVQTRPSNSRHQSDHRNNNRRQQQDNRPRQNKQEKPPQRKQQANNRERNR